MSRGDNIHEDVEVVTNVFIQEYQVMPEAAVDIIDSMHSGYCPICSGETCNEIKIPLPGSTFNWVCEECNAAILIEVWEA